MTDPASLAADLTADDRDALAQQTAQYIAAMPQPNGRDGITILGAEGKPSSVQDIKATLLDGRVWLSWIDDRVTQAMNELHPELADERTEA